MHTPATAKLLFVLSLLLGGHLLAAEWKPVPGNLLTRWAAKVDPRCPLPEYPRPQLQRENWTNLNGLWQYAIVAEGTGHPDQWDGQILVPFAVESALSGVKKPLSPDKRLWYRRTFAAPKLGNGRLLLHFGAVDWETQVFLNGALLGEHRGGYDSFHFDITAVVKPDDNELSLCVFDETGGCQPRGKQLLKAITQPGGIMYTPCSGIWQTVWLERVPASYIESLRITPDVDAGCVRLRAAVRGAAAGPVKYVVLDGGREVASAAAPADAEVAIPIPEPKLWSPDAPHLYDLLVTLGEDRLRSYFGMRKIALGKDEKGVTRILLNGKYVFQSGPLDQGFWPDGIYTAPTDEALRFDIEATKRLGFNMTRKHVKIEPARWYYWCDKLGLLVWQDMPSGGGGKGAGKDKKSGALHDGAPVSPEAAAQFEAELKALVEQHGNAPSIIMWVVFNEGWGQYDTPRLTRWVKSLDPSRLVNNASGWHDIPAGDVVDMHSYPGPNCPAFEPSRAAVLGEFGGLGLAIDGHKWVDKSWGYRGMADQQALTRKYLDLWRGVRQLDQEKGLCAAVYTQITDVETECNGLLTYDREIFKVAPAVAHAALVHGQFPPTPQYRTLVPAAAEKAATWRYTSSKPADGWFQPDFNAAGWQEGLSGFGTRSTPGAIVGTEWKTADIWLRREVELPAGKRGEILLRAHHDEDAEIYLNGLLAARLAGFLRDYEEVAILPAAARTLRPGKNLIAIHCRQTKGGQYIDAGLVELVAPSGNKHQ